MYYIDVIVHVVIILQLLHLYLLIIGYSYVLILSLDFLTFALLVLRRDMWIHPAQAGSTE